MDHGGVWWTAHQAGLDTINHALLNMMTWDGFAKAVIDHRGP